ncbi:hypothetical protein F4818DRAFT_440614 [Hypoxylon cercidicola]|nr:hypothetical protein F4818DRAFT_440614 [Hypoxylon cercidicola]
MRPVLLLVAAAFCCLVGAAWLPQETGIVSGVQPGWTPKPTPAPGAAQPESERVLGLLLKRETQGNWTNSLTCGWMSGVSSSAWTCGENSTCATNQDHIVACVSESLSEFFSVCLDHSAYVASSCGDGARGTGCCTKTGYGACATYLWTGQPARSMYRCAPSSTVIGMLDEPQFVLDASLSTTAHAGSDHDHDHDHGDGVDSSEPDPTDPATAGSSTRLAVFLGWAFGGLLVFGVGLSVFLYYRHKRRTQYRQLQENANIALNPARPAATLDPASASPEPASGHLSPLRVARVRGAPTVGGNAPDSDSHVVVPPPAYNQHVASYRVHSAPTEASSSSPTERFPSYNEPSLNGSEGAPPHYSFFNPHPNAMPVVSSSQPRQNSPDEGIELGNMPPQPHTTTGPHTDNADSK